jgi:hypothetical protein
MSEVDDLRKQVAELKDRIDPPPRQPSTHRRYDPTEGMSMPRSAMQAMIDAVPFSLMSDIRADARKPNPVTASPAPQATTQKRGTGWIEERKLEPPPGIAILDRIMDVRDANDKTDLAMRLAMSAVKEGGK